MPETRDQERRAAGVPARRFESPRAIRALAHPARLAIISALRAGEELTATQCAELTGLSPSATAYHLKLLERYGFAEAAPPRPDRRERPWRMAASPVRVEMDTSTPAGAAAAAGVVAAYIDATRDVAAEFTESEAAEPQEWRNAVLSTADVWLTAEELARLGKELTAVLAPYRERERQPGSRRVRVMNVAVPHRHSRPAPG